MLESASKPAARPQQDVPALPSKDQVVLNQTLMQCLQEVKTVEHINSTLQNRIFQQDEHIRYLQRELAKLDEIKQENSQVHAVNLKLQAKVLLLEKSNGNQELVLNDLQRKYTVLEGYYNELLEFVEQEQTQKHV